MTSIDNFPPEILENIIDRLPHSGKFALRQVSRRFSTFIPACNFSNLKISMFPNKIHICSTSLDRLVAQNFLSVHDQSIKSWKSRHSETQKINCYRTFAFPPSNKFSFFYAARIGHLEINNILPIFIEGDNLQHLTNLLSGCVVDKVTLILDKITMKNVHTLPAFLVSLHAKHVEFVLQQRYQYDMVSEFMREDFPAKLAMCGIREVTFSGDTNHGRAKQGKRNDGGSRHGNTEAFELLLSLFNEGIETVTVNPDAIVNNQMEINVFDSLLSKLAKLGKSIRLYLNSTSRFYNGNERLVRNGDEAYGMIVDMTKSTIKPRHRISIEYRRTEVEE